MDQHKNRTALATQASYTLADAIAYLLGLIQRGFVQAEIKVTLDGIAEEDLGEISRLPGTLNEHLVALLNAAKIEHNPVEEARIKNLFLAADIYKQYLTDEIAKGSGSEVRIDPIATQEAGIPHFTLKSIKEWHSNNKEALDREIGITNSSIATKSDTVQSADDDTTSATKLRNLNFTLGLLLELFIRQDNCKPLLKNGNKPNFNKFGESLEKLASEMKHSNVSGQSSQTIRKSLSDAYKEMQNA